MTSLFIYKPKDSNTLEITVSNCIKININALNVEDAINSLETIAKAYLKQIGAEDDNTEFDQYSFDEIKSLARLIVSGISSIREIEYSLSIDHELNIKIHQNAAMEFNLGTMMSKFF